MTGATPAAEPEKAKDSQKAAAALDAITDHVDEQEVSSSAAAALTDSMQAVLSAGPAKAPTAPKVKIAAADVARIVELLEVDEKTAERALRANKGDLVQALIELVR